MERTTFCHIAHNITGQNHGHDHPGRSLLFDRDGETLVKPASGRQAARASTWPAGDTVQVDERGRVVSHQPQQENQRAANSDLGPPLVVRPGDAGVADQDAEAWPGG